MSLPVVFFTVENFLVVMLKFFICTNITEILSLRGDHVKTF